MPIKNLVGELDKGLGGKSGSLLVIFSEPCAGEKKVVRCLLPCEEKFKYTVKLKDR